MLLRSYSKSAMKYEQKLCMSSSFFFHEDSNNTKKEKAQQMTELLNEDLSPKLKIKMN